MKIIKGLVGAGSLALALALVPLPAAAHPDIDTQIADLTHRIEEHPDDGKLWLRRGELHRVHRDWAKAEADYNAALSADPSLLTARFCLGRLKLESGQAEAAIPILDGYLAERPTDGEALTIRAKAKMSIGDPLGAVRDLDRAIQSPRGGTPRPETYLERARALMAAGPEHRDEAIRGLDDGLATLGDAITLQLYALDLEIDDARYDAALARLDTMAKGSVRQEPWLLRKAEVMEAAGRGSDALQLYRQALTSIEALPASRRTNRAVQRIENQARAAVVRLGVETAER